LVNRLAEETARAVKDPEMQARFAQSGARLVGNTPDQFAAMVTTERARWEKIIRAAGIKAQ
jgi:tripartite-type tricarboxylate transporter receptor subunit TctC